MAELSEVERIYTDGFDAHLRVPLENLLRDQAHVLVGESPIGLAVLRQLGPTGWVFLRYFVAGSRGQGVGAQLWSHVTRAMAEAGYSRMVYDVEDPGEHLVEGTEVVIRKRRIGFYERLGAQLLPVSGYLPPHGDDTHPMLLMAADLDQAQTPPLDDEDLRRVVEAVYEHRYGLPANDPVVQHTLSESGLSPIRT
jgi:GNAT superfamily N-acetyltransferase